VIALLLAAGFAGCGTDRAPVKNLLDRPHLFAPSPATVEELLVLKPPAWSRRARRRQIERMVVTVDVDVFDIRTEEDGDLHVVIATPGGKGMIAEFPLAECTAGSPFGEQMHDARATLLDLVRRPFKRLRLTGVIFFDKIHGQIGVAPNGVELHPVLKVEALP
jgi:hypothetical protein